MTGDIQLGQRIQKARMDATMSREQVAKRSDTTALYLKQIEQGLRMPSLPMFIAICNTLRVAPTYLLRDKLTLPLPDAYQKLIDTLDSATPRQANLIVKMVDTAATFIHENENIE